MQYICILALNAQLLGIDLLLTSQGLVSEDRRRTIAHCTGRYPLIPILFLSLHSLSPGHGAGGYDEALARNRHIIGENFKGAAGEIYLVDVNLVHISTQINTLLPKVPAQLVTIDT